MSGEPVGEDELHALVDGQLSMARRAEVDAWLATHADDAARVADYRVQRAAIQAALGGVMEEPVPARLNLRTMSGGARRGAIPVLLNTWYAAAAALLLFFSGMSGWALRGWVEPAPHGIALLAQEAASSYAVYAPDTVRPFEIAGSQKVALDEWVSRRIGRTVRAPDLGSAGFSLLGGRLIATAHGPAGMFLYDNPQGARIALLVRPMEIDKTAAMRANRIGGTGGFAWADEGLGFSMVGPSSLDGMSMLAKEMRRQVRATSI